MTDLLKKLRIDIRIKMGYGAAFVLLLLSYILTWYANRELVTQSKWAIRSKTLINHIEGLNSCMKDAEAGARGYIITNDRGFLAPYLQSRLKVDSIFNLLKSETKENATQQITLYMIKTLINRKYDILDSGIRKYRECRFDLYDSAEGPHYEGKAIIDSIRKEMDIMKMREQAVSESRDRSLHKRYIAMNVIIITSLALAFIFAVLGFITYMRENKARKSADEKVEKYQQQLKRRIKELDQANKELIEMRSREQFAATGRFARTIAHEVRNPLTNIDLAVSQLKTEFPNMDENTALLFDMIARNSSRINLLITDLLNATRFTDLNYEKASANILLDEALELAADRIKLNHIRIEKHYTAALPDIMVDKEKIKIAFLNIIVNAIEVMEAGEGLLKISTSVEGNKCVVTITDNGIGMDAAAKDKLFEPYFTTKPKGNGLGLTNTQNIILNHKATIHVESELGKGASFVIKFDIA